VPEEELEDGVTKLVFDGEEYIFWNKAEIVLPFIYEYLKNYFPSQLILREFNHIDFVVLGENLPIEVQSTIILGRSNIGSSYFEQMIEKQIKQNVERYGHCWFFFDSEFLRYLKSRISRANRLDLGWLINYMHGELVKAFVINYCGEIKHLSIKNIEYIKKKVDYNELNNNEVKILSQVILGHGYSSKEIRSFYYNKKYLQNRAAFATWLRRKEQPEREKRLGYILFTISSDLRIIDDLFAFGEVDWNRVSTAASFLGILYYENETKLWSMEDLYDINKYFPSYNKNRAFWDELKHRKFLKLEFETIIRGAGN